MKIESVVERHSFSNETLADNKELVQRLLEIKAACAIANARAGVISEEKSLMIQSSCEKLKSLISSRLFPVDLFQGGGGIAVNQNLNHAISSMYSEKLTAEDCNASQSTADVCATAVRLVLQSSWPKLLSQLESCRETLIEKSIEFNGVPTLARTCLRDASRVPLGNKFHGYAASLNRRVTALKLCTESLFKVSIGGTALGTGEGAPFAYSSQVVNDLSVSTGLSLRRRESLTDASQNMDDIGEFSHQLTLLAETLIKMVKDMRLLQSGPAGGFAEITFPKTMEGSSFFADKNNPVVLESLLQCCFLLLGQHRTVVACIEHAELDLNVFELMAGVHVQKMVLYMERALKNFNQHALFGLNANEKRCFELSAKASELKGKSDGTSHRTSQT